MSIKDEYRKARQRATAKARYYKKRTGAIIELPAIPKKITEGSIRRLEKLVGEQVEQEKKDLRRARYAEQRRKKKEKTVRLTDVIIWKIRSLINEGVELGGWESDKAFVLDGLLTAKLDGLTDDEERDYFRRLLKRIPDIERMVERFIFESTQSYTTGTRHNHDAWKALESAILGEESTHWVFEPYEYDMEGDYYED